MTLKILSCSNRSPARTVPLSDNIFFNKVAPIVRHNMLKNPLFCYFASFPIVSLTHFINNSDSSRDLTTLMIFSISLFEVITVVVPEQ